MAIDKLVDSAQLDADLTSVADAIRARSGESGSLSFPNGFVAAVNNIEGITDVQVNGTSVVTSGVANIQRAAIGTLGVVSVDGDYGINTNQNGRIYVNRATDTQIKSATGQYRPITPYNQHESSFYGLAKAAGADMASLASTTVGEYPDAQKVAIQKMLGIYEPPYVLLNDETVNERTCFDFTTDSNGTPYNLLSVFIEVYYAENLVTEDSGYGRYYFYNNDGAYVSTETGRYVTNSLSQYKLIEIINRSNLKISRYSRMTNTGNQASWCTKSGIAMANADNNRGGYYFDFGNITRIAMHTSDYEPAGTKIKIWGQWAY